MPASRLRILLQEVRHVHEQSNDWTDSSEQVHLARNRGELLDYNASLIKQDEELVTTIGLEASILQKQQHLRFLGLQPNAAQIWIHLILNLRWRLQGKDIAESWNRAGIQTAE